MAVHLLWRRAMTRLVVLAGTAALAPNAGAATPTATLDQSAGTAAGSTANLGLDLTFAPTGSDSPQNMTLALPAGLIANASVDGGACLRSSTVPNPACQVGTGTVTAVPVVPLIGPLLGLPTVSVSILSGELRPGGSAGAQRPGGTGGGRRRRPAGEHRRGLRAPVERSRRRGF